MPILSWFLVTLRLTHYSLTEYIYKIFNDILSSQCTVAVHYRLQNTFVLTRCNILTLRTSPVRILIGIIYTNLNRENNIQKLNTGPVTPFFLPLLSQKQLSYFIYLLNKSFPIIQSLNVDLQHIRSTLRQFKNSIFQNDNRVKLQRYCAFKHILICLRFQFQ